MWIALMIARIIIEDDHNAMIVASESMAIGEPVRPRASRSSSFVSSGIGDVSSSSVR